MGTEKQLKDLENKIAEYKKRYLSKKESLELDESSTRLMINYFLTEVLGYIELEEIKTEFRISDKYADYVIQLGRKKHFIVEVKAINLDLTDKHFRQALEYSANEGVDWIMLTNGREIKIYRVIFKKPIEHKEIFSINLIDKIAKDKINQISLLTKVSVQKGEIEEYWNRFKVLEPATLAKFFYQKKIINYIKSNLKNKYQIRFSDDDLLESVHQILKTEIENEKPNSPTE